MTKEVWFERYPYLAAPTRVVHRNGWLAIAIYLASIMVLPVFGGLLLRGDFRVLGILAGAAIPALVLFKVAGPRTRHLPPE